MKTLQFDIMLRGRYIATLHYRHSGTVAIAELEQYATSKLPTLKGKPFKIEL